MGLEIFKNFWKDKKVAAVANTSSFSIRKVCRKIDFDKDNVIVEYGPGTGVFPDYLLNHITPNSKLILLETNENLIEQLENKYKDEDRVEIYHDSAENVEEVMKKSGEDKADYIISGIPFSFFSKRLKTRILKATRKVLDKNGKFLVYQYSPHLNNYLKRFFDDVNIEFSILNIPPVTIFEVKKAAKEPVAKTAG